MAPASDTCHIGIASDTAERARAAIEGWLLGEHVQLGRGEHAGAVAGWLDAHECAEYVYPEITGYYLQWLAWHALRHGDTTNVSARAAAAQRWLSRWANQERPATRTYLVARSDWRNRALFFFDVAMVVRGLGWAVHADLIEPDTRLTMRLSDLLSRLIGVDGMFDACVSDDASHPLPDRWSTRRGPFLTKAADGIVFASRHLPGLAPEVIAAAAATFDASVRLAIEQPHAETHPLLYAFEGLLNCDDTAVVDRALVGVAPHYDALMRRMDDDGYLPEGPGATGALRLDIVAQALRVGTLMSGRRPATVDSFVDHRARMTRLLVRHTAPTGAIPFAPDASPLQFSVWTAMFAEQALAIASPIADVDTEVALATAHCLV